MTNEEKDIKQIIRKKNSILIFIFLVVANLFLYFVTNVSSVEAIKFYGGLTSFIFFAFILAGLFASMSNVMNRLSRYYYVGLFVVSVILLVDKIISGNIGPMLNYFYVLAVLIALLLALLDLKQSNQEITIIRKYNMQVRKMRGDVQKSESIAEKEKAKAEEYKNSAEKLKEQAREKSDEARSVSAELASERRRAANLEMAQKELEERLERQSKLKKRARTVSAALLAEKKRATKLEKEQKTLEAQLEKQSELKRQYSHSLRSIRKQKKEEQELLVVSADGKSVHRPHCIAVRHLLKEHRKLIKNWKTAKKEKYMGCKLCKPHIKPKIIQKGNVKYKFVASKISDKVHKPTCTLVRNIDNKDKAYFRSYRAALKKGYTGCRVCNPGQ